MTNKKFDVKEMTIKDLLTSRNPVYRVPVYQRPFSWDKEQLDQLWTDLEGAFEDNRREEYFLGAIVLTRGDEGSFLIIDGQQRIAALTAIFAALRDHLEDLDKDNADELHQLIFYKDSVTKKTKPILTLNGPENDYLGDYVQKRISERPTGKTKRATGARGRPRKIHMQEAFKMYNESVQKIIVPNAPNEKNRERLMGIGQFIRDQVVAITTVVDSDIDAYIVFETLNDRGLSLSTADLVKNHLYSRARDRLSEVIGLWEQTNNSLEGTDFTRFLRHYWLSKHRRVTKRKLFVEIKQYLAKEEENPLQFASNLAIEAADYRDLMEPPLRGRYSEDLADLREMSIQQHLPLLLAARAKNLKSEEFESLLSVCTSLTMRHQIVGNLNPNELEANYSKWAISLRNSKDKIKAIEEIKKEAGNLCPKDQEFIEGFKLLAEQRTATARYILRKINEHMEQIRIPLGREKGIKGPYDVHVEHILPMNPPKNWSPNIPMSNEEEKEDARNLAQKLGNLTLLGEGINKKISNKPFKEKKDYYRKSEILITRNLCEIDEWDESTITERQKKFAELAPKIWKRPGE